MRYAYVKPNNAVREITRVGIRPEALLEGGPDAYVAHFSKNVGKNPCLILSTHGHEPQEDEVYKEKNVVAISYYCNFKFFQRFGAFGKSYIATFFGEMRHSNTNIVWGRIKLYYFFLGKSKNLLKQFIE